MLTQKIKDKTVTVAVLGLGHVGYPMSTLFGKNGFQTIGYDINTQRLNDIKQGKVLLELTSILPTDEQEKQKALAEIKKNVQLSNSEEDLKNADVYVVDVPTPLKENETPNLVFLTNTCKAISMCLKKGNLVVVESTIYPGATEEIVKPILEESGLEAGKDFYLSFSPERIDPGNKKWSLELIPKIVGGINKESVDVACLLFSKIVAKVVPASSLQVAEATKMVENLFRSVNIALINDLSKFFEKMGIDTWETIAAASTKPFGFMPHYPGPGVGGHCIPKDPFYLLYKARKMGMNLEFVEEAAAVNKNMPLYVVHLIEDTLKMQNKSLRGSSFAVLGVTYKKDVLDLRRTPAKTVITELCKFSKDVVTFDPMTTESYGAKTGKTLEETIKNKDCIVLLADHAYFKENNLEDKINKLSPNCCVVDTRNFVDETKLKASILCRCLGKPVKSGQ